MTIELPQCTLSGRTSAMHISLDSLTPDVPVLEDNLRMSRKSRRDLLVQSG